jgi:hypothetical protein
MKQTVKLFKAALCGMLTIVVFVAVQDVASSYKYTQFKHASFKLHNSIYVLDWNITAYQAFFMSCFGQ